MIYSVICFILIYTVYTTKGKAESDRHEALVNGGGITSQGNPVTTGLFSYALLKIFRDYKILYSVFWVSLLGVMYYENVSTIYLLLLFPFMLRTALYRLEEVYFIMIPIYFALHGLGFLWLTVLFWRNPFAGLKVIKKPLNKRALILDYCLFIIFIIYIDFI